MNNKVVIKNEIIMERSLNAILVKPIGQFKPRLFSRFILLILVFGATVIYSGIYAQTTQGIVISGTVKDSENGNPLPFVTVIVQGMYVGTSTDLSGYYSITVPNEKSVLVFSFIGYNSQSITVGKQKQISISLTVQSSALDEVVVIGYGVQKKETSVGSIASTTNEQLKKTGNVSDLRQALSGQLPGVTTLTTSGEPGGFGRGTSSTSIYIRGRNTWNGGEPLILVDGFERDINNIDVSEVEKISVLKDASATAVFGVKGANGVILVTTKRGSIGKPKISFSYNSTAMSVSKVPGRMDSYNAILTRNEAIEREVPINELSWKDYKPYDLAINYKTPQKPENIELFPNVDWKKAMLKDVGFSHRAVLNVQGGTKFVDYFGSLSYIHEGSMMRHYENDRSYEPSFDFDRFNFRSNLNFKLTKTTNLAINLSGYISEKNNALTWYTEAIGTENWIWNSLYTMAPDLFIPKYSDGTWGWDDKTESNPAAAAWCLGSLVRRTTQMNSNIDLAQNLDFITKGLSAKGSFFLDNNILAEGGILDKTTHTRPSGGNIPIKKFDLNLYTGPDQDPSEYTKYYPEGGLNQYDWSLDPWLIRPEMTGGTAWSPTIPVERHMQYQFQLKYDRLFGKHNVGALGIFKREEYAIGSMFKNYREDWVFRTVYDYDRRYLFEVNGAYNGSEQFGPGYRFHFFPSVAAGWVVSNEEFFKIDWLNRLKIRFSTGIVGDDNVSSGLRWLYSSQYSSGGAVLLNQNPNYSSPYTRYDESVVGNPLIRWEKAIKYDLGIETGLFDDFISVTYDYFKENRTDILISGFFRTIPPFFGAKEPPTANLGEVTSSGHELEVKFDSRNKIKMGIHAWAALAYTHTENEIIFRDDPEMTPDHIKYAGHAINQTYTLVRTGFMNNWDEVYASVQRESNDLEKFPGHYNILDYTPDGITNDYDEVPFAYTDIPQNTFNATIGADYKGFSIMVQFYGVTNVSRNIDQRDFYDNTDLVFDHVKDAWSKDNLDATSHLPTWKTYGLNVGDYFIYDASYLRLKTAEIAYTFQNRLINKVDVSALRIFLNGNNIFYWSKLPDDREYASLTSGTSGRGTYPTVKRFNLGIELTF